MLIIVLALWLRLAKALGAPWETGDRRGWSGSGPQGPVGTTVTLHTTESPGGSLEGARDTLHAKRAESHALIEPRLRVGRRAVQLVDLERAAKALRNLPGGTETNRLGVNLQVEVIGFAALPEDLTEGDYLWLGERLGEMADAMGVPKVCQVEFHDYPPENGIRLNGREPWRVHPTIRRIVGFLGHMHWLENVHGDPGNLSRRYYRDGTTSAIELILEGANGHPATTTPGRSPNMLNAAEVKQIADELEERLKPLAVGLIATHRNTEDLTKRAKSARGFGYAAITGIAAIAKATRLALAGDAAGATAALTKVDDVGELYKVAVAETK